MGTEVKKLRKALNTFEESEGREALNHLKVSAARDVATDHERLMARRFAAAVDMHGFGDGLALDTLAALGRWLEANDEAE